MVAPPGVWMTQAACPHQVAVVTAGVAAAGAAAAGFPGTTGGAIPGLSAMIGAGAGAAAAGGAAAAVAGRAAGAFLSGTANSTSARAIDTAPATSRVTHTIDERFMTPSFQCVGRLTNCTAFRAERRGIAPIAVSHFFTFAGRPSLDKGSCFN